MNWENSLLSLAIPHYKKGRTGDVKHIQFHHRRCLELKNEILQAGIDFETVIALCLLHDTGYSCVSKKANPFDLRIRKLHSQEGARIAQIILKKTDFPKEKISKVTHLILHHDDWAFGKPLDSAEWRVFTDIDFAWMANSKGFDIVRGFLKQTPKQFLKTLKRFYEEKQEQFPFFLKKSQQLYLNDLKQILVKFKNKPD
ncbi:MAG: HD domain-containing protein [Candidatus Woesearchaeota archaeon]|nr:HD domain-containing protein [Candidatus Woesearchaeota archaeon]